MYKASPLSREEIEDYVWRLKKRLRISRIQYINVVQLLENVLTVMFPEYNYEIIPVEDMPNRYAETDPTNKIIRIREDVYDRACDDNPRDRFTIAHEIGHLFLHREINIVLFSSNGKSCLPKREDPEWQANVFAGELLASSCSIKGLSEQEVSELYGISLTAARIQLSHAN